MTWTLAVQYQLLKNTLVELTYEGSASVGDLETPNLNVLSAGLSGGRHGGPDDV